MQLLSYLDEEDFPPTSEEIFHEETTNPPGEDEAESHEESLSGTDQPFEQTEDNSSVCV